MPNNNQGRGWHGDSAGHAKAGRKGGQASSKNRDNSSDRSPNSNNENEFESDRTSSDSSMSDNI